MFDLSLKSILLSTILSTIIFTLLYLFEIDIPMYFYLKEPKSSSETLIILQYYLREEKRIFKFSTQLKIHPEDWDFKNRVPLNKRGAGGVKLKHLNSNLNQYSSFLDELISYSNITGKKLNRELLRRKFEEKFKRKKTFNDFIYFTDFIDDFCDKAHLLINRFTKRNHTKDKIKHYRLAGNRIKDFENHINRRVRIDSFDLEMYDAFVLFCMEIKKYSVNGTGDIIKNVKVLLKKAKEFGFDIHRDIELPEFSVLREESFSVVLDEEEIEKIFLHDFSDNLRLSNCRDIAIIGLWTGLRVSDFLSLPNINPESKFIEVKPKKTANTSGIKVIIPIHPQIKKILTIRGMPKMISDVKFNLYIKEVCMEVGITNKVKGSLMDLETNRKKVDFYPKYKLISSHACRRSFATNLYKMDFPTLSIMKITGHTTERSFLKYIKVTPSEHAEKLLKHWNQYYLDKK